MDLGEVLGKRSGPGAGGLANLRDCSFLLLVCRCPALRKVLVSLEKVLAFLKGAWIQERCLDLGEVLGSRRGAWI